MTIQTAKGTRDFAPEKAITRQKLVNTLREVFELYGYSPIENPILQSFETLTSKYAGGEEILKEIFRLKDQRGRELALRYDLTVPMCIYLAANPNIKLPFKSYRAGEVFRDGPIKSGRYRQFTQCDVDVVGVAGMEADAEILMIIQNFFRRIGLPFVIKINNRKLLEGIFNGLFPNSKDFEGFVLALDKLDKIGKEGVEKELRQKGFDNEQILQKFISLGKLELGDIQRIPQVFNFQNELFSQGLKEIETLAMLLDEGSEFVVSLSLARGLSYYTGTVFETFLEKSEIKSSVAAGGRYDEMIGKFLGSKNIYPAVGVSFGVDVILDALGQKEKSAKTTATAFVVPIKTFTEALKIAQKLREKGINTEIDLLGRSISKNLEYANSLNIPFVIFAGEQELKQGKVKLRDMASGNEKLLTIGQASEEIKNKSTDRKPA